MDIHTIVFVVTFLFIHIDSCSHKSRQQELKQKDKFKEFSFKEMQLFIVHSTYRRKKSLMFSVKFKTEEASVNLSDLLPCKVFLHGVY